MILSLFRALDTVPISITNKLENKERKKHTLFNIKSKLSSMGSAPVECTVSIFGMLLNVCLL